MSTHEQHPIEKLANEVEFRQRNTTWPDAMVNASNADELMWKGSRRITKVQRIGVGLFGLVFLFLGVLFVLGGVGITNMSDGNFSLMEVLFGLASGGVGCKLLWNSIRKNELSKSAGKNE
jgi:hypothetical protein